MKKSITQTLLMWTRYALSGLLITCLLNSSLLADKVAAQSVDKVRISLRLTDAPLEQAFNQIENLTQFTFAFNKDQFSLSSKVNLAVENETLRNILLELSRQTNLAFRQVNQHILVKALDKPRNTPLQERISVEPTSLVTGKVTEAESGEPLPGVNILVKNTALGTVSDIDGTYRIEVPEENNTLIFSFIGYAQQEVNINGRSTIDVVMQPSGRELDEIVVIGYGEVKREDLIASVSKVSGEEIQEVSTSGLDHALQGRAPGVLVTQTSAAPGGGVSVRIRGGNSILGGNEPLYVIDGFPVYNNNSLYSPGNVGQAPNALASINPNDIASIEILKDASATAIYGSRGANGVILITTKKGQYNSQQVSFEAYYGLQQVANQLGLLNAREFVTISNEAHLNDGLEPIFDAPENYGEGTNWQDVIFRTAPTQNYQLSFSGGNDATRYAVMGNYFSQDGIIKGSGFERGSFRVNLDSRISDKLKTGTSLLVSRTLNDQNIADTGEGGLFGGVMNYALTISPTIAVRDENGRYNVNNLPSSPPVGNPLALAIEPLNQIITNRVLGNVFAEYDFTEQLSLKVSFGSDLTDATRDLFLPSTVRRASTDKGQASIFTNRITSWLNENVLSYRTLLGEKHELDLVAGLTAQGQEFRSSLASSFGFSADQFGTDNLGAGSSPQSPASARRGWQMLSYLARANYQFNDRYLFSLTARADGSSKFGEGNQWGFYPAAAAAWRVSNEGFMQDQTLISELKLRASYGVTGNQEIGEYQSLAALGNQNYIIGDDLVNGIGPTRIANPDLKWETTAQTDIGLDVGFLENRVLLTADYYYKRTEDLLLFVTLPSVTGFTRALQNSGSLENQGFELAIDAEVLNGAFQWTLGGNLSFNRNKVLNLGSTGEFPSGAVVGSIGLNYSGVVREGEPIGNFNAYVFDGIFQNQQEVDSHRAQPNAQPGDIRYRDLNGDNLINTSDQQIIGYAQPDFAYGLSSNMQYKNFRLNLLFNGVQGVDVLNMNKFELESVSGVTSQLSLVLNRWTPENPSNSIPRASTSPDFRFSSRQLEDASFLRLRNITLAYQLPAELLEARFIRSARVYVTGQNLLTLTSYSGYDPEVNTFAGQDNLSLGIDYGTYPRAKTYLLGVNLTF
jgi:TonB-linked SusC/RagA family outer membrane protein